MFIHHNKKTQIPKYFESRFLTQQSSYLEAPGIKRTSRCGQNISMWYVCELPHQAPWWREGVALKCGMCAAQENGQQRRRTCSQTVTSDHQLILLQTSTRKTLIELLISLLDNVSAAEQLSQVQCWTPDSESHRWLVSCRCSVQLEKCPAVERHYSKHKHAVREITHYNWCSGYVVLMLNLMLRQM